MTQQRSKTTEWIVAICAIATVVISLVALFKSNNATQEKITTSPPIEKHKPKIKDTFQIVEPIETHQEETEDQSKLFESCLSVFLKSEYRYLPTCYNDFLRNRKYSTCRSLLGKAKAMFRDVKMVEYFNIKLNDLDIIEKFDLDNAYGEYSDYTIVAVKNQKYGVLAKNGEILLDIIFEDINPQFFYPLIMIEQKGKFGFADQKGKVVQPLNFDSVDPQMAHPMIAFQVDSLWGLIDTLGKVIQEPQFEELFYPYESRIGVKKNGIYGFINDVDGNIEIDIKYNSIEQFKEGKAKVRLYDKEFFIDKEGNLIR